MGNVMTGKDLKEYNYAPNYRKIKIIQNKIRLNAGETKYFYLNVGYEGMNKVYINTSVLLFGYGASGSVKNYYKIYDKMFYYNKLYFLENNKECQMSRSSLNIVFFEKKPNINYDIILTVNNHIHDALDFIYYITVLSI